MQGLLNHLCQQNKQIKIKLKISIVKLISQITMNNQSPATAPKTYWCINTNAIGVNVQVYTTSNKVMSIQDHLHKD